MRFDLSLITGIVIGVGVGLHFTVQLGGYLPLFVIAGGILILRYLHPVR